MGQDFFAAFGVGETDTRLSTIDADGVALAAIQCLHQLVQQKDCEIAELRKQHENRTEHMESEISNLKSEMAQLRTLVHTKNNNKAGGGQ